jgi:phosphoribosylglycinamide formyltransferase-1
MKKKKVAILISGRGSNMQALIEAARAPDYPAEIIRVISNRPGAAGLARAEAAGIATETIDHKAYSSREAFDAALNARLQTCGAELVCNAGFMRLLTGSFVDAWHDRQINIHPSLLPAFPGLDTHARALAAGVRFTGCTVHFVRTQMDSGPIIAQAVVPILPDDDDGRLAARVLEAEHRIYPLALGLVAAGRTRVMGDRVLVDGAAFPTESVISPRT